MKAHVFGCAIDPADQMLVVVGEDDVEFVTLTDDGAIGPHVLLTSADALRLIEVLRPLVEGRRP